MRRNPRAKRRQFSKSCAADAKRIEAGRDQMIGGLCESPLTMRAIVQWRDALMDGKMLRRVRGCSGRRCA